MRTSLFKEQTVKNIYNSCGSNDLSEYLTVVFKYTNQHSSKLSIWGHWTLFIYIFSPALKGFVDSAILNLRASLFFSVWMYAVFWYCMKWLQST